MQFHSAFSAAGAMQWGFSTYLRKLTLSINVNTMRSYIDSAECFSVDGNCRIRIQFS